MPRITVSYRRKDTDAITGRIFDRLVLHYGRGSVFRDIDNIPPGVDFREHINNALRNTDILIAVVGRKWLGPVKAGKARIANKDDPVRLEVETALQGGVTVIPVLVGDAKMPTAAELPKSLEKFAFRHALRIDSGQDFEQHTERLIRAMDRSLGKGGRLADRVSQSALAVPEEAVQKTGTARPEWGGYTKASIARYLGSYLVIRCAFKNAGNVYTYATDFSWDEADGGMIFQERNRADARYSHRGQIWIPELSPYLYLVTATKGWLRAVTLSAFDLDSELRGVISTLHNLAGTMYVPIVSPIVYVKRESFDQDSFGELTAGDPRYADYLTILKKTVTDTHVRIVMP